MSVTIGASIPEERELAALYRAVGWTSYADDPARLMRAVEGSSIVLSARDGDALIGFARAVGDGAHVTFLSDLLVSPDRQRTGVGRRLLEAVEERTVGRLVLLTDADGPGAFYASAGLSEAGQLGLAAYVRVPPA